MEQTLECQLTLPGEPVPKGRPRFTRAGHVYTPAKTRKAENDWAWLCKTVAPMHGEVWLDVTFYGQVLADVDNLLKLVMDGIVKGGLIRDDSSVSAVLARKVKSPQARTELRVLRPTVVQLELAV